MSKKITFGLSVKEVQDAIKEIENYQQYLKKKCEEFCSRIASTGKVVAEAKVAESPLGKYVSVAIDIQPQTTGCKAILFSVGQDITNQWQTQDGVKSATINTLLMVEFGSGISLNPIQNPNASKLGYGTGTFEGQTHAFDDSWYYMDLAGEWHATKGIKATMPMYSADMEIILNIRKTAKEVFGS